MGSRRYHSRGCDTIPCGGVSIERIPPLLTPLLPRLESSRFLAILQSRKKIQGGKSFQFFHIIMMWMKVRDDVPFRSTLIVIPNLSWILIYRFSTADAAQPWLAQIWRVHSCVIKNCEGSLEFEFFLPSPFDDCFTAHKFHANFIAKLDEEEKFVFSGVREVFPKLIRHHSHHARQCCRVIKMSSQ